MQTGALFGSGVLFGGDFEVGGKVHQVFNWAVFDASSDLGSELEDVITWFSGFLIHTSNFLLLSSYKSWRVSRVRTVGTELEDVSAELKAHGEGIGSIVVFVSWEAA